MAYEPENTPVTFLSIMRSRSVRSFTALMYSSTAAFCSGVVTSSTYLLSGASTMNVTPNTVSARVVNISSARSSRPSMLKRISAPSERPIQLRCVSLIDSDHSILSRPLRRRSAYADTRRHHCHISFCTTGYPPRTERPSLTSSLASTVPSLGHQFTIVLPR